MATTLFVTGTDTGVGKTLFTASLLAFLRSRGHRAWALKPFCSGGRADAQLFCDLQDGELPLEGVNPIHFAEAVAPLVAARKHRQSVDAGTVIEQVRRLEKGCEWLLVEGCGGVLVPLTETHMVIDFIRELGCATVVVGRNRLGAINQSLLTVRALSQKGIGVRALVLMEPRRATLVTRTNKVLLAQLLKPISVLPFRYLGRNQSRPGAVKKSLNKVKKTLAPLLRLDTLTGV